MVGRARVTRNIGGVCCEHGRVRERGEQDCVRNGRTMAADVDLETVKEDWNSEKTIS